MARRTVHLPDDLDKRVRESGTIGDSFSGVVQEALRRYLDAEAARTEREHDEREAEAQEGEELEA